MLYELDITKSLSATTAKLKAIIEHIEVLYEYEEPSTKLRRKIKSAKFRDEIDISHY